METPIIIAIVGAISSLLTIPITIAVQSWFNKDKNVADAASSIANASESSVHSMEMSMKALQERLDFSNQKISALIIENKKMQEELKNVSSQNRLLLEENHILHAKVDNIIKSTQPIDPVD